MANTLQKVWKKIKQMKRKAKLRRNNESVTSKRQETIIRLGLSPKGASIKADSLDSDEANGSDSEWTG